MIGYAVGGFRLTPPTVMCFELFASNCASCVDDSVEASRHSGRLGHCQPNFPDGIAGTDIGLYYTMKSSQSPVWNAELA
jgi:hypothetical protein